VAGYIKNAKIKIEEAKVGTLTFVNTFPFQVEVVEKTEGDDDKAKEVEYVQIVKGTNYLPFLEQYGEDEDLPPFSDWKAV